MNTQQSEKEKVVEKLFFKSKNYWKRRFPNCLLLSVLTQKSNSLLGLVLLLPRQTTYPNILIVHKSYFINIERLYKKSLRRTSIYV